MSHKLSKKQIQEGWRIVKFGEIARQCKEKVDRDNNPFERYIEGGHMDSECLRISRWRTFGDGYVGPAFHRIFRKGQILYGSRRTYLKKVAVAEFDGITANTTFVLEAQNKEKILPGLLPFIMLSEPFTQHSVKNSKGSTNPYINWSDIANFEFPLPPLERQKEILEILEKVEEATYRSQERLQYLKNFKTHTARNLLLQGLSFNQLFGKKYSELPNGWKKIPFGDVIDRIQYGLSEALQKEGQYPILRMMNIERGYVVPNDLKYIDLDSKISSKFILQKNDILFNRTNSMDWVGRTGLFKQKGNYVFASYLLRINIKANIISPFYVNQYLNLPVVQYRLKAYATPSVNQANINPNSLRQLPFLLPPAEHIKTADMLLKSLDESISKSIKHHGLILKAAGKIRNSMLH